MDANISGAAIGLIPLVVALTSLFKLYAPARFAPLAAVGFGIAGSILVVTGGVAAIVITGLVIGLTASGLYSGAKATFSPLQDGFQE